MKKLVIAAGVLFALGAATIPTLVMKQTPVVAGETAQMVSGFATGQGTPAFDVKDVTGPWKADPKVCYI
jgi:hypothetical protein